MRSIGALFLGRHVGLPLLFLLLACASTQVAPARPAVLRVVNGARSPADVFVDGYLLAVAPPNQVRALSSLPPGTVTVAVVTRDGSARVERRVVLEPGRDVLIELAVAEPTTPAVPESGVGGLEIVNPHASGFSLLLDGEALGTVFEKTTRRFDDQVAGARVLLVTSPEGLVVTRLDLEIQPRQLTRVELLVPTGDLILTNGLDEDLAVTVDGRAAGKVSPATPLRLADLLAGRVDIEATGLKTFRRHRVQVVLHADEIREVSLAGDPGTIQVKNATQEAVELRLDGTLAATLPSGHTTRLEGVTPGEHRLEATGRATGLLLASTVSLLQGEAITWELDACYGVVTIENDSGEPQRVSLDGLEAAVLPPYRTIDLPSVPVGAHTLVASGARDAARVEGRVEASAGARAVFVIPAGGVRLSLKNTLAEPVRVYREAVWLTEVDAGSVRVLDKVPAGKFLLEAVGLASDRIVRREVSTTGDDVVWEIVAEVGFVTVTNGSGERLKASPELSGQKLELAPGEAWRFTLPPGRHRLVLGGTTSGLTYARAVDLKAQATELWAIPRPLGTVQVFNRTPEDARLQVDKTDAGLVRAGGSVVLKDVRAGRLSLVAQLATSGQVLRHAPFLQPDGLTYWELERHYARVLVENNLDEAARLEIDGQVWTNLAAGEARVLDKITPGPHHFVGIGARSNARVEAELAVSATRDTRWTMEGTRGVLALTNRTAEPLAVVLGDRAVGTLAVGATRRYSAPAGKTLLVLRGVRSQNAWRQWVVVKAARTWDLAVTSLYARFRVTNHLDVPVTLAFAKRRVDDLAPGATLDFEQACPRARVELAATTDAKVTHARTLPCRINEDQEWTIE